MMKNIWAQRWHEKHDTEFHINWDTLLGDTIKERMEDIYVFLTNLYTKRGGHTVQASPEAGCIFDTGCQGFYPMSASDEQSMALGGSYRIRYGGTYGLFANFWIMPSIKEPVFKILTDKQTLTVWLDNFVI